MVIVVIVQIIIATITGCVEKGVITSMDLLTIIVVPAAAKVTIIRTVVIIVILHLSYCIVRIVITWLDTAAA